MDDQTHVVQLKYIPRKYQEELHKKLRRFSVVLCHRRFGKSVFAINHLINAAIKSKKVMPRFAYLAPTYGQAKRISWSYFHYYLDNFPGVVFNEAELRIDFTHNDARIMLLSAENPMSLKGIYLDIAVLDEFAEMPPMVFTEVIRPTLSDRRGEALFIGTIKGQNHFWDYYQFAISGEDKDWFGANYKASETGILPEEELASARATMPDAEYKQEYENDPLAGLVGAYFKDQLAEAELGGRIGDVPHDKGCVVDTYWDLGIGDMCAIWFVQSKDAVHYMIDHYQASGQAIPDILYEIRKKNYNWGAFVFPHDVQARDFSTGKTRLQTFFSLGVRNTRVVPKVGSKRESIDAARRIFNKCRFDKVKCREGLKMLANYQKRWDSKGMCFADAPLHNNASNSADAFQCFAMGCRPDSGETEWEREARTGELVAETEYDLFGG